MSAPTFTSQYAPLRPDGPLPPGFDERVLANAYKSSGILPKRVLLELGIRKYSETAAVRLRRALDDNRNRLSLHTSRRVTPLHLTLYRFMVEQPAYATIYHRIIEPAEVQRNRNGESVLELSTSQLESRIYDDQKDHSWSDYSISPQSEAEGLVLFVLAYGLLQPDEAYDILRPVLSIGSAFSAYFGANFESARPEETVSISVPKSPDSSEAAMRMPEQPAASDPRVASDKGASSAESLTAPQVKPYVGPRTQRISNLSPMWERAGCCDWNSAGPSSWTK